MILGFLAAVGSTIASTVIIESVTAGVGLGISIYTATRRMKAYSFTTRSGKNVPQIILQGNWVEQWGFEIGCSVSVECYQNKLVILKD